MACAGQNVRESFHTLYYGARDIGAGGGEYYDSASTHAVIDFLTTYDGSAPFYLQIGYVNPHDVCEYLHNHEEKRVPNPLQQGIIPEDELPPLPENFHYDESETVLQQVCRRTDDALIHAADSERYTGLGRIPLAVSYLELLPIHRKG